MIADMGAGARFHILSQRKKMIWAAIKNPLPRMIADMGAGARFHILSQRKNDMGGDKKIRYHE